MGNADQKRKRRRPSAGVGERTVVTVDLIGGSEAVYIEKREFSGVELSDFLDPPYAHGDHLEVFLTFELDGDNYP